MAAGALNAVPDQHRETIRAALRAVLGSAPIDAVVPIVSGASAGAIFRIESGRHRLVVRVEGPRSPLRNPYQYASMRIAAEAGIGPEVHFVDEANGIAMTDFVEQRSLREYPGGPSALARALGALLARLQATPPFPVFVEYPAIVARLFVHVRRTGLFASGLLDAHVERLERIRESYSWDPANSVSAHNDLYADNILFDGTRLWLIDWESAYRNDPLVDVAVLFDNLATSMELQEVLLRAWLGRDPDKALHARLSQVRALTRLYYAGVLLSASATRTRSAPDTDLSAPTLPEFQAAMRDGQLRPGTPEAVHTMGKMYLSGFLTGAAVPALAPS